MEVSIYNTYKNFSQVNVDGNKKDSPEEVLRVYKLLVEALKPEPRKKSPKPKNKPEEVK